MNLADMTISGYIDLLSIDAPTPGGGAAAALAGAQGIALTSMVCALTVGKQKYAPYEALTQESMEKAQALKTQFLAAMDRDAQAFQAVAAVFFMLKATEEEKATRAAAMQTALMGCTHPPIEIMELSLESLQLTSALLGKSNTNAVSDLGVAALSLKSAVQSAWLNVCINLGSIKDQNFVSQHRNRGEAILATALPLADEIYQSVLDSL